MLYCFYTIVARDGQTDGQISYINIARQRVDARWWIGLQLTEERRYQVQIVHSLPVFWGPEKTNVSSVNSMVRL